MRRDYFTPSEDCACATNQKGYILGEVVGKESQELTGSRSFREILESKPLGAIILGPSNDGAQASATVTATSQASTITLFLNPETTLVSEGDGVDQQRSQDIELGARSVRTRLEYYLVYHPGVWSGVQFLRQEFTGGGRLRIYHGK
ncbi:hypothetical protein Slin14017_G077690 [Septoria linicola]|nr:hypothetical protein Slin14017_G077690 [Septoria linicola]